MVTATPTAPVPVEHAPAAGAHLLAAGTQADGLSADAAAKVKLGKDRLLWIDLDLRSADSEAFLEVIAGHCDEHAGEVRELLKPGRKPHADDFRDLLRVEVVGLDPQHDFVPDAVVCLVGDGWVATSHEAEARFIEDFRSALEGGSDAGKLDAPAFLAVLLAWQVRTYQDGIDAITEQIDDLDADLLAARSSATDEALSRLVALRRRLSQMRRLLAPHRAVYQRLASPELDRLSTSESAAAFGHLKADTDDAIEGIHSARDMLLGSFEILTAQTSHRTNEVMKTLTFVSIVLLPSTLVAGVMGMNFKPGLFGHPGLFWVTIAAMLSLMAATIAVAWRRGWIGSGPRFDPATDAELGAPLEELGGLDDDRDARARARDAA